MPSQLGYWAIRGLAQPIRLLLNYVGEDFEDVKYEVGDGPDYDRSAWLNVKFTFGLDFPNLPYFIDGDIKLTQSNAILRHLARKHNLYGDNEKERAHTDLLLDQIMDVRNGFVRLCYGPQYDDAKRDSYIEGVKKSFATFEQYLGNKKFFLGDKVTVSDFHIYEMADQHRIFEPSILKEFPNLTEYVKRFESLPAIKAYMASDKFLVRPLNNKSANFK